MSTLQTYKLERAKSPEEVGVSSKAINDMLDDFKMSGVEVHSIMILRHNKVAYESWAYPFTPDTPHIMYSVSKSFTSTAVGFAIDEGLLSLETKFIDVFPEFAKKFPDDTNLEKLTVYHLLTMTSGKSPSVLTDRTKNQWLLDFVNSPWKFTPGEKWEYISENQYVLCAMINRLAQMSVRDYLLPRLFEPLSIKYPFWECDGNGIEAGGWGLYITTEELANFIQCYANGGKWFGKQVIPENWVKFATSFLEDNSKENFDSDTICGYGACFWQNNGAKGYRADGMFSQFAIVLEDYDACAVITSCEIDEQKTRDCFWRHFPSGFFSGEYEGETTDVSHLDSLPELPVSKTKSTFEEILKTKKINIKSIMPLEIINFPLSVLPIFPVFMSVDKAGYCTGFEFDFDYKKNECKMTWTEKEDKNSIICGMDGKARFSSMHLGGINYTASSTACWINNNNLCVWIRPLGAIGQRRMRFEFSSDLGVTLYPSSYQNLTIVADNLSLIYVGMTKSLVGKAAIGNSFSNFLPAFLEPKHSCKLVERTTADLQTI